MRHDWQRRFLFVGLLSLAACTDPTARAQERPGPAPELRAEALDSEAPDAGAADLSRAFRAAADRTLPAVVSIQVERASDEEGARVPEAFRYFFELPEELEVPPELGAGSGFILDERGLILTNHHVVEDTAYIQVRLHDGREYDAAILGSDPSTDVALLQVTPKAGERLPHVDLVDSASLSVGDWVLALGSPLGLDFTVTAGIVSAKGRHLTGRQSALESFIQTDAAINPGNSGGPLVDLAGRVVGINTAIFGGGTFVGYGFAIPAELVRRVVGDLQKYGEVRRPQLGVQVSNVTAVDAEIYGLEEIAGADVNAVPPDTPAARAGLRLSDVIVALDGQPVVDADGLTTALIQRRPGETVELAVIRDGRRRTLAVRLGEFQGGERAERSREARPRTESALGFRAEELDAELARRLGYERVDGVVIAEVGPLGSAANAGLRVGHLLVSVDRRPVRTLAELQAIAERIPPGAALSVVVRSPREGETVINYRVRR